MRGRARAGRLLRGRLPGGRDGGAVKAAQIVKDRRAPAWVRKAARDLEREPLKVSNWCEQLKLAAWEQLYQEGNR